MLKRKRITLLFAAMTILLTAAVACGTDASNGAPASASDSTGETTSLPVASDSGTEADTGSPAGDEPAAAGGLDPVCVELVLGRTATGFGDITDAERTRIFEECSAGARQRRGGGLAAGFDPVCVQAAIGIEVSDFTELTPEQRQTLFEQCGGDGQPGGFEGRRGDGERPAGGFGGAGFAGLLENECVQNALGGSVTDITQLSQEQIQQALTQCSAELDLPAGGFGGFGGRQDGGQGRFGGGQVAPAN